MDLLFTAFISCEFAGVARHAHTESLTIQRVRSVVDPSRSAPTRLRHLTDLTKNPISTDPTMDATSESARTMVNAPTIGHTIGAHPIRSVCSDPTTTVVDARMVADPSRTISGSMRMGDDLTRMDDSTRMLAEPKRTVAGAMTLPTDADLTRTVDPIRIGADFSSFVDPTSTGADPMRLQTASSPSSSSSSSSSGSQQSAR
jgi:hypothetical protein